MIDKRLAPNFWLSEFLHSETATRLMIDNTPTQIALANLETVTGPGMQRVRDILGVPVIISSGYRSPVLNRHVGGSKTSAHMHGLAVDFTAPEYGTPRKVIERLIQHANLIRFDQLIIEGGRWIHCAWPEAGKQARGQVLTATFSDRGVEYREGVS